MSGDEFNDRLKRLGNYALPKITYPDLSEQFRETDRLLQEQQERIARAANERIARETTIAAAAEHSLIAAEVAVESLTQAIGEYEETLGDCEEIAIFAIGGPAGKEFFPRLIRPLNPDKVLFAGLDENDRPFTIVQHVSQLNFAMMAKYVAEEEKVRRVVMGSARKPDDE